MTFFGQEICSLCRMHLKFIRFSLFHFTQFMDLRTRYTALVTLMTQYVKFASETLKRTEDEEVRDPYFNASWLSTFTVAYTAHFRLLGSLGCLNL